MQIRFLRQSGPSYAAKQGRTPAIQRDAEQKAQSAMTDGFVSQLQQQAKRDAQRGVYMDGAAIQLQRAQMRQFVSPDRAGPIGQTTALLQQAARQKDPMLELLDNLLNQCSGKIQSSPQGQTAELYAPNGEIIASYNSLGSGWTEIQTKAEQKFLSAAAIVYAQAFREARAEQKAARVPSLASSDDSSAEFRA